MATIQEACSVCSKAFKVMFRYQMEEHNGSFVFFCSQLCLQNSQRAGGTQDSTGVACQACAKRFTLRLASQIFYSPAGERRYACSMHCRAQLMREQQGARLGDIAAQAAASTVTEPHPPVQQHPRRRHDDHGAQVQPITPPPSSVPRPAAPPRRIAVFNHKGGTAKTTTSVNLAAGLASRGHKVLLLDTDSQGNVAVSFGAKCERTLYHVLVMGLPVASATQQVRPNLDLLPSNETLAAAELYLAGRQKRDRVLLQRMA